MSLKDDIASRAKPRIVEVEFSDGLEGEPLKLKFRALKYLERKSIVTNKFVKVGTDKDQRPVMQIPNDKIPDLNCEFLAASLVDDDGNPMFTKDEIIKDWDSTTADKMTNAGMKALGMTDKKETEENPSDAKNGSGEA